MDTGFCNTCGNSIDPRQGGGLCSVCRLPFCRNHWGLDHPHEQLTVTDQGWSNVADLGSHRYYFEKGLCNEHARDAVRDSLREALRLGIRRPQSSLSWALRQLSTGLIPVEPPVALPDALRRCWEARQQDGIPPRVSSVEIANDVATIFRAAGLVPAPTETTQVFAPRRWQRSPRTQTVVSPGVWFLYIDTKSAGYSTVARGLEFGPDGQIGETGSVRPGDVWGKEIGAVALAVADILDSGGNTGAER